MSTYTKAIQHNPINIHTKREKRWRHPSKVSNSPSTMTKTTRFLLSMHLVKYFVTLQNMIDDIGVTETSSIPVIPLYGEVNRELVTWMIEFYRQYDEAEKVEEERNEPIYDDVVYETSKDRQAKIFKSMLNKIKGATLEDWFSVIRFLNYIDAKILLDKVVNHTIKELMHDSVKRKRDSDEIESLLDRELPDDIKALIEPILEKAFHFNKSHTISCGATYALYKKGDNLYYIGGEDSDSRKGMSGSFRRKDYNLKPIVVQTPSDDIIIGTVSNESHSVVMTTSGLYGLGKNYYGGGSSANHTLNLSKIDTLPKEAIIYDVSCGLYHTMFLTSDGLYGCGVNTENQVTGYSTRDINTYEEYEEYEARKQIDKPIKIQVRGDEEVRHVSCGADFTVFTTASNKVYCTKTGDELGFSSPRTSDETHALVNIPFSPEILLLACSESHIMLLTSGGLYGWGRNSTGALTGSPPDQSVIKKPLLISIPIPVDTIKSMVAAGDKILFLTHDGVVYCRGGLAYRKPIDYPKEFTSFKKVMEGVSTVACGGSTTFYKMNDGRLIITGIYEKNDRDRGLTYTVDIVEQSSPQIIKGEPPQKKIRLKGLQQCNTCCNDDVIVLMRENDSLFHTKRLFCHLQCQDKYYDFKLGHNVTFIL